MQTTLKEISQIRFGYYSQHTAGNGIPYLQSRQFDNEGNLIAAPDTFLSGDSKVTVQLLKDGDIIYAGKGNKNFAWCYHEQFGPAIASTVFFVISPDRRKILPGYLTVILNHPRTKLYIQGLGLGTNIQSIRKEELGEFNVPIVSLQMQAKIVELNELHKQDIKLTLRLLQRKNELYESVIDALVNNN